MSGKQTEWKQVDLSKETLDFSGALSVHLENDRSELIALTFKLKNGKKVRIRKANYGVTIEEIVIPMETKYQIRTKDGLSLLTADREKAEEIKDKYEDAEIVELVEPKQQPQVEELPF